MSNMTRIPKWTAPGRKFNSQFGNRKPYEPDIQRESKNARNPSRQEAPQASDPPPVPLYYGTHGVLQRYDNKDMRVHNRDRITKERVTRLGIFNNGCQSEVIVNNVSNRVQRKVDKRIRQLVAPEEDVEWVRQTDTNAILSAADDRFTRHLREPQTDRIGVVSTSTVDNRFTRNVREPQPDRIGVVSTSTVDNRFTRNVREPQTHRLRAVTTRASDSRITRNAREPHANRQDVLSALDSSNIANSSQSIIPGRFSRYEQYESMVQLSSSRNGRERSFNATDNNANCTAITACIPSIQLAKRLFSGMADLPLHEAGELLNTGAIEVLGNGLNDVIHSTRPKDKDDMDNRALSYLINRTEYIFNNPARSNCTVREERSDYIFPSSPKMFERSAPRTPSIEKAFNNTLHCALDTELEISVERDSRLTREISVAPNPHSISPFFMMTPMSEVQNGFEDFVPEGTHPDFSSLF